MKSLLNQIDKIKKSEVKSTIDLRLAEFESLGRKTSGELFKELCFCILTANYSAEGGIRIQREIGDGFLDLPEPELAKKLKTLGYRFPNMRAAYIAEARRHACSIRKTIGSFEDESELRDWLVMNVKGIGYKEASHFMRNIGYSDVAILDFHIIDVLAEHGLVEKPKSMTKARYLEIESLLKKIARRAGLTLGELDFYLWYMETGKVLK